MDMPITMSYLTHIGTAVPSNAFTQTELIDHFAQYSKLSAQAQDKLERVFLGSAIDKRHFVLDFREDLSKYFSSSFSITERMQWYQHYASALGIQAIRNSGISEDTLQSITHLITVSCTGMFAPGIDVEIINACNIPSTVARTCIYFMGCAAVVNALKTADAICQSNPNARVLIVSVELCSLHFQVQSEDDAIVANALFADGAACALVQSQTDSPQKVSLDIFYSDLLKGTKKHMAWAIRNEGFLITLSSFIPLLISSGLRKLISPMMKFYGSSFEEIDYFAIHPGGPKILKKIEETLNIPPSHNAVAYEVLKTYGNMSSATILFILQNLLKTIPDNKKENKLLGMAFGPGLTVESFLLKVSYD